MFIKCFRWFEGYYNQRKGTQNQTTKAKDRDWRSRQIPPDSAPMATPLWSDYFPSNLFMSFRGYKKWYILICYRQPNMGEISGGLGFLIWRSTIKLYLFHVSSKDQGVLHHMVWCSWCTSDLLDSRLHVKSGWSTECITSSGSGDSNSSTTCEQNHWKREIIWAIDGHISF